MPVFVSVFSCYVSQRSFCVHLQISLALATPANVWINLIPYILQHCTGASSIDVHFSSLKLFDVPWGPAVGGRRCHDFSKLKRHGTEKPLKVTTGQEATVVAPPGRLAISVVDKDSVTDRQTRSRVPRKGVFCFDRKYPVSLFKPQKAPFGSQQSVPPAIHSFPLTSTQSLHLPSMRSQHRRRPHRLPLALGSTHLVHQP